MNPTDLYPEMLHPYDPRFNPLPAPEVDICAGPVHTICVNAEWWSHISGMIARLTYRDAWTGTDDEISDAIESIYKILNVGRPTMGCGCGCGESGRLTRYNADGVFQVSDDDGATWTDYPQGDYRNTVTLFPPLPGADGDDKKCQIATNIRGHLEHNADQLAANAEAWGELALLIGAIAALAIFMFPVALALAASTPFWLGAGGALLTAGKAAFEAAMTTAVFDTLECIIYCHMQPDGTFSDADFAAIKAAIAAQIGGVAEAYLWDIIDGLGKTGLANMGRTGSGLAADCSDCECADDLRVFSWDEVSEGAVELFPDEDGVYTAHSGTVTSGPYYVAWILFQPRTEWEPTTWNCHNITEISNGTGHGPFKYRCSDFAADSLATCAAAYTYYSNAGTFDVTFTVGDLCGEH